MKPVSPSGGAGKVVIKTCTARWSKVFLKVKKQRLGGDTKRAATSTEVTALKQDNDPLKPLLAELMPKNNGLEKSVLDADLTWEDE